MTIERKQVLAFWIQVVTLIILAVHLVLSLKTQQRLKALESTPRQESEPRKQLERAVDIYLATTNTEATPVELRLQISSNGITWDAFSFPVLIQETNMISVVTNFPISGVKYLRIHAAE